MAKRVAQGGKKKEKFSYMATQQIKPKLNDKARYLCVALLLISAFVAFKANNRIFCLDVW